MSALDCPVCLDRFDLNDRLPKVLPCSGAHDLCKACLMLLRPEDGDEFVCPSCREVIERGTRINDNRALIAALEEAAKVESSPLAANGDKEQQR